MKLKYTKKDIRYTTKDYKIYAILMGATDPGEQLALTAFAKENIRDVPAIKSVSFFGNSGKTAWEYDEEKGLLVSAPSQTTDEMATVIKITVSQ